MINVIMKEMRGCPTWKKTILSTAKQRHVVKLLMENLKMTMMMMRMVLMMMMRMRMIVKNLMRLTQVTKLRAKNPILRVE